MQAIVLMTLMSTFVQGFRIDNSNNVLEYDETAFQVLPFPLPYNEYEPTRREEHIQKKDLLEPVANDLSVVPAISNVLRLFKGGINFLLSNLPVVLFGTVAAFGACALTPICNTRILDMLPTADDLQNIYRNPERLTRAAEFVETAIRKFQAFNK
ncbi:uncharacterized protein LOC125060300 [Pieris napi]|uniref:uncharacterized protein LOC125060300 n=1 Tax=Pieris napi TaxID=78633 RepID=UPI001FB988BA|nr:uncharacterized protein LOC125060300 [Pieris napi]